MMGRYIQVESQMKKMRRLFLLIFCFVISGCIRNVPPSAETETPVYAVTYVETATPRKTIQWISTPTAIPFIQVSPGIGEGITITEQEINVHYEDLTEPLSPGLYIVYQTLDIADNGDLNYEIWARSVESGGKTKLIECTACPIVIEHLETHIDLSGSWRIIAVAAGTERGIDIVLVFDLVQRRTRMVKCQSDNPEKYCRISWFTGKLIVFSEDYPFIDVELAMSRWTVISGAVFDAQDWDYRFFPGGEIYFYPLRDCGETNSYRVTIIGNDYDVEELPPLSGICEFDPSPLILGKSSSSTDSRIAYVVGRSIAPYPWFWFFEEGVFDSVHPDDSIVICSSDSLYASDKDECNKFAYDIANVLPFSVESQGNKFGWLDDNLFIWEKPAGMLEGQIIGTMDLNGNVQTIYQGEGITYEVSPDGKWLLYRRTEAPLSFGLLSTEDGSTIYLPLPEDTVDATWLLIP
ncbi:hypothetical protein [Anaerolinea sp.]|uniref:hypothetical protein n=1 Tax=Anaerolinea sp. TaxID=1872519 RepID=UPI002ACD4565|nr:hypothetical protein [Anaerolinea sp.]